MPSEPFGLPRRMYLELRFWTIFFSTTALMIGGAGKACEKDLVLMEEEEMCDVWIRQLTVTLP